MARGNKLRVVFYVCGVAWCALATREVCAADPPDIRQELLLLRQQNQALQQQLEKQQSLIDSLTQKVSEIQATSLQSSREVDHLKGEVENNATAPGKSANFNLGQVHLSGEGGVGFFNSGSKGAFPNAEFRVDEAKLFVDAPIWGNVYFFTELNLITREASDLSLQLGEAYLDFENVSGLWNWDRVLNIRAGRMDIPFGEEYLSRDAIDNPLISHSLSDIWGVDEGLEFYGKAGKFGYVVAVQNGGPSGNRDFDADKSIAGRVSFDPAPWLHLSASGMRTGDLKLPGDNWSELWFGNAWVFPLGSTNMNKYHANLVEGDVVLHLPQVQVRAFGGMLHYDDNDSPGNNRRDVYYYSVEATHDFGSKFYAGVRFSQIFADKGFPIAGNGDLNQYVFSGVLTQDIWRLSLGLGYRWSQNFLLKTEYTFEQGELVGGENRNHEDLFAVEAAFKF